MTFLNEGALLVFRRQTINLQSCSERTELDYSCQWLDHYFPLVVVLPFDIKCIKVIQKHQSDEWEQFQDFMWTCIYEMNENTNFVPTVTSILFITELDFLQLHRNISHSHFLPQRTKLHRGCRRWWAYTAPTSQVHTQTLFYFLHLAKKKAVTIKYSCRHWKWILQNKCNFFFFYLT